MTSSTTASRSQKLRHAGAPLLLCAIAALLIFVDLGGPVLWEDEADTALYARSIREHGVPLAWDGRNFTDSDDGFRVAPRLLGETLVMVGTPWLPYYVAAASFAVFGESEWAARLPFAIAGLATVVLLYFFVLRTTQCARSAFAAALLLLASTQFLLYARECRSYSLNMLLTIGLLWGFVRLGERRRDPWLAVCAVLLFHVQILPAAIALGACAGLALFHPAFRGRLVPLLARAPWVAAFTLPWLPITWSAVRTNWEPLTGVAEIPARLGQLGVEASIAIPFLGWAIGLPVVWRRLLPRDRTLLYPCLAWVALAVVLAPLALSQSLLEVVGLRYVCGVIPVSAAVTGLLVARAARGRSIAYAALLVLFAATHVAASAIPWLVAGESRRAGGVLVQVPRETPDKLLNLQWWDFVRGLGVRDPGTLPPLAELLRSHAGHDDVVVTNFGWDSLYYYTDLPQAMRIAPDAPVRRAAHAFGLPAYVFDFDQADWIVWRGDNKSVLGYELFLYGYPLDFVLNRLRSRGARIEPIAVLPETLWDNRPELFWHRFPGAGHPFASRLMGAQGPRYRDAQVFRVQRPARAGEVAPNRQPTRPD